MAWSTSSLAASGVAPTAGNVVVDAIVATVVGIVVLVLSCVDKISGGVCNPFRLL